MAIDPNTDKLIASLMATISHARRLAKKVGPLTPGERESLSVALSVIEAFFNLWKVRENFERRFSKNDARSWAKSVADQRAKLDRNSAAVLLGYLGASKGGTARAKKLSPSKRAAIARRAARARWSATLRPKSS